MGANAQDLEIVVPIGTTVSIIESNASFENNSSFNDVNDNASNDSKETYLDVLFKRVSSYYILKQQDNQKDRLEFLNSRIPQDLPRVEMESVDLMHDGDERLIVQGNHTILNG